MIHLKIDYGRCTRYNKHSVTSSSVITNDRIMAQIKEYQDRICLGTQLQKYYLMPFVAYILRFWRLGKVDFVHCNIYRCTC